MRIRSSALGLAVALLLPLSANAESATPSSAATSDQGDASNPATMAFYNDVEDVLQDPKTELGEDFAGAWIDSTDRQVVNVAFKGEDASRNAKSDPKKSKLANDERVRFVALRFSTRDLAKTSAHAVGTLVKLLKGSSPKDGLFTVTVNTQENMIDVDIDSAVSDRKDEIDKEFAKDIEAGTIRIAYDREVEQIDDGPNTCLPETGTESLVTRQNCQPTRGGLVLTMASGGSCTSGFVFKSTFGVRYLSTAGHCGYTGISYSHGGTEIGDSIFSSRIDGNSIDASLIDYENENIALPNNSIFRYGASDTRITTKITAPDATLIDKPLCSEAQSGRKCGTLTSYSVSFVAQDGVTTTQQGRVSGESVCSGDSGGPVVNTDTNKAYGLVKGHFGTGTCGNTWAFTWTAYVEDQSTMELMLNRASDRMDRPQSLRGQYVDQWMVSDNLQINGVMQQDGNFVVYGPSSYCGADGICWKETRGGPGTRVVMKGDGDLVFYDPTLGAFCVTGTRLTGGHYIKLKNTGELVIYNSADTAVWRRAEGYNPSSCGTA